MDIDNREVILKAATECSVGQVEDTQAPCVVVPTR